ncbi:unnamed protein product, partial [Staurois parvus]
MVSWQKTPAAFSGSPDGTGLPEKAVEGSGGGGGYHLPLLVKAILQTSSWYNHSNPVMYQYIAGPCWLYT